MNGCELGALPPNCSRRISMSYHAACGSGMDKHRPAREPVRALCRGCAEQRCLLLRAKGIGAKP